MIQPSIVLAKLSGIRRALLDALNENVSRNRSAGELKTRVTFETDQVKHYFVQAQNLLGDLRASLPDLYGDFQTLETIPSVEMMGRPGEEAPFHYSRSQLERLVRDIDQIFEIRANSELSPPKQPPIRRVFISHGRSQDWRAVQAFIEKDVKLPTVELAQEPNMGRTIIEKLLDNATRCDSAVIVMTGDDIAKPDESRVRENVMHEIGLFQGTYGRTAVVLLHEEGVSIPTNLSGVAYVPFPKGNIEAGFHVLQRELKALYGG